MSANPVISSEPEACPSEVAGFIPGLPVLVSSRTAQIPHRSGQRLLGTLGIIVTLAVLALGLYSVARYLF